MVDHAAGSDTLKVRKRDGRLVAMAKERIDVAVEKAFRAELNLADGQPLPESVQADIVTITDQVVELASSVTRRDSMSVEQIQDVVEIGLMRREHFRVARRYILYRSEQAKLRAVRHSESGLEPDASRDVARPPQVRLQIEDGVFVPFDRARLERFLAEIPESRQNGIEIEEVVSEVIRGSFDGMTPDDVARGLVLSARSRIERHLSYDSFSAALQRALIYRQTLGITQLDDRFEQTYRDRFEHYVIEGVRNELLADEMREFHLGRLAEALRPERDLRFKYLGAQTIFDRYLLHLNGRRIETPQYFWMRVAMGVALAEPEQHRTERAIEFYNLLSTFRFTSATPTLFNAGTRHPQLSSCYLTTVQDDLKQIFKSVGDNAVLSKWAGGLGNDWTRVRATGSLIKGTNGTSQGVIPFLKIVNDAAVAVNQGGKRKGAVCAYLEPWHLDFEEFLDLRKNTGDDRRRTHDMHTAAWIPDLFMERVESNGSWTLFSPDEVPELHECYGETFRQTYEQYEQLASRGKLRQHRTVAAIDLWRKLLTRTFETGHPWVTFKDPSNIRSPQDHAGVVHSSNLCTEILLNTSEDETAVCNLGSINLAAHVQDGELNVELLQRTIHVAMRMLDNVIDVNFYPTPEAANANQRHRPVGLGMMGYQDALHDLKLEIESDEAVAFADRSMELVSFYALLASTKLAAERGVYESYHGSKWDRGLLPIDTIDLMEQQRGQNVLMDRSATLDWSVVRNAIQSHGMRNSNCLAIAPTATISTIIGVTQSIEPTYKHLYAKSNLSGDFIQVNQRLVEALSERGLWDEAMVEQLKYYDGTVAEVERIPEDLKRRFATAFEIDPRWLIEAASRRQKWIDQGQSLNLYVARPSGKAIDGMYRLAWQMGLKTTYYMRSLAATQVEKSTVDVNRHGIQPRWMKSQSQSGQIRVDRSESVSACSIEDPDCEACQ